MSQQNNDNTNDTVFIMLGILILYLVGVYFLGDKLLELNLAFREGWLKAATWIWPRASWMQALQALDILHTTEWTPRQLDQLSNIVRPLMFFPMAIIVVLYGYRIWIRNPGTQFRRVFRRERLVKSESRNWPWIRPMLSLDLVEAPIDSGPWAMATRPLDFCRKYRLLTGKTVDRVRTEKLFAAQLGRLWEGPEHLSPYKRGLYACFVAHACRDKKAAMAGLKILANTMADGKLDVSFADAILEEHGQDERVVSVHRRHAYVVTVMAGMLQAARRCGVVQPAMFLWLRPVNRTLWYTLNGTGRRTAFCDVAGIQAHYLAESIANQALEQPYIGKAVDALDKALREVRFEN